MIIHNCVAPPSGVGGVGPHGALECGPFKCFVSVRDDISVLTPPPLLGRYRAHDYLQVFLAYWGTANSEASSVQLVVVCVAAATTA